MGKHGRHKKNLKKEKSKVKFKVGKTLPKGQNITDTSFKVKKILIKEQLKSGNLEPVTKRNLSLKETLSRLQHHNTNMKLDNLNGLKEILSKNPDLMSSNLSSILEKLADMITDKESSIRREAISQLTFVIGKIPATKLSPFVCLICSYLGAALSHINKDVQADALLLLDGILSVPHFPGLILSTSPVSPSSSHPFDLILQGLLNQISQESETQDTQKRSGWERKLNVDPEAKLADTQRRIRVLQQLRTLLKSAFDKRKKAKGQGNPGDLSKTVVWEEITKSGGYIAVIEPSYIVSNCVMLPRTSSYSFNVRGPSLYEPLAQEQQLRELATALIPMLMESWKEVAPSKAGIFGHDITPDVAELLKLILDLMFILLEAMKLCEKDSIVAGNLTQWFKSSFSRQVFSLLMPSFPFSGRGSNKKKNRSRRKMVKSSFWKVEDVGMSDQLEKEYSDYGSKISSECLEQNLLLAQLFCSLELTKSSEKKNKRLPSPQNYLDTVIKFLSLAIEDAVLCHRYEKQINAIVWTLLTSGRLCDSSDGKLRLHVDKIEPVINSLAMCKPKECPLRGDSCVSNCLLFKLLCNIIKERSLEELHRIESLQRWMEKLPSILPFSNYQSIKVLNDMARQCNSPLFHAALKDVLPNIFLLLKTEPKYLENREELRTSLALLHWVRDWDAKELKNLEEIVQKYPKETSPLIEIFRVRREYLGKRSKLSLLLDLLPWWKDKPVVN